MNASHAPPTAPQATNPITPSPMKPNPNARPDVGREPRRPAEVVPRRPERRAQHAAAVERQRREQVEGEQEQVRHPEPADDPVDHVRQLEPRGERDADEPDRERHERPGDRDPELGAGRGEHALELRHAAEEPQRDPVDLHPLAPGHERVPELVREQRGEEEHRGRDRADERAGAGEPDVPVLEVALDRPDDEREDDEPAPVDADLDPGDAAEADARGHASSSTGRAEATSRCPPAS